MPAPGTPPVTDDEPTFPGCAAAVVEVLAFLPLPAWGPGGCFLCTSTAAGLEARTAACKHAHRGAGALLP